MRRETVLDLLIFFAILSQGIATSSPEQNQKKSLDIHMRKKRMINELPDGNKPEKIENVPYIVNIVYQKCSACVGTILSPRSILTVAHCVMHANAKYTILSGSSLANRGQIHHIKKKYIHPDFNLDKYPNDLALFLIDPPLDLERSPNRKIELIEHPLPSDAIGTVSGWGCNGMTGSTSHFPDELRSIKVPIISQERCRDIYKGIHNLYNITDNDICTLHERGELRCGIGDCGAPLVFNGRLVGTLFFGGTYEQRDKPDVYLRLANYKNWISAHMQ